MQGEKAPAGGRLPLGEGGPGEALTGAPRAFVVLTVHQKNIKFLFTFYKPSVILGHIPSANRGGKNKSSERKVRMMKRKLTAREIVAVASLLFGLFFGAGNLIFPVHMGQMAGANSVVAILGFIVTAVGLPLLAIVSMALSRSESLAELSGRVGKHYGIFFTCLLYLTIGPCFAIPRCASTSFTVGMAPLVGEDQQALALLIFSTVFFALVLYFSLRPSGILTYVGKVINPVFLVFLLLLIIAALLNPTAGLTEVAPEGNYVNHPFVTGFLEGYNTMDILAALAFGITIVQVIKELGVEKPQDVAGATYRAGLFSSLLMAVIYALITLMGVFSRGVFATSENGGIALTQIAHHYFGPAGQLILAATVTLACLKTSIGLVTSCAETFGLLFPKVSYKAWTIAFSVFPLVVSNFGLTQIITLSLPVLMFLYPLAITLILLTVFGKFYGNDRKIYVSVTACTFLAAILDLLNALPASAIEAIHVTGLLSWAGRTLPLFSLGLGWLLPAAIGLVIGLVWRKVKP